MPHSKMYAKADVANIMPNGLPPGCLDAWTPGRLDVEAVCRWRMPHGDADGIWCRWRMVPKPMPAWRMVYGADGDAESCMPKPGRLDAWMPDAWGPGYRRRMPRLGCRVLDVEANAEAWTPGRMDAWGLGPDAWGPDAWVPYGGMAMPMSKPMPMAYGAACRWRKPMPMP